MKYPFFLLLLFFFLTGCAQNTPLRVMFYNVENLFDCRHDDGKNDYEFTPEGKKKWTQGRYNHKLNNIAKVIAATGEGRAVVLAGLCEVENETVINDLIAVPILKKEKYDYVMTHSPDRRGINVALLYQQSAFKLLQKNDIRIDFRNKKNKTRDILHVAGKVRSGDTLDVFVCHFPSRVGDEKAGEKTNEKASEGLRNYVATVLKKQTDSIMAIRKTPNILIMGDFNDLPSDASLYHILNARPETGDIPPTGLSNLFYRLMKKGEGTCYYQGKWYLFDQIIVSGTLLDRHKPLHVKPNSARIFRKDFLLQKGKNGEEKPFRTYIGTKHAGGFSDHLPVLVDLEIEKK